MNGDDRGFLISQLGKGSHCRKTFKVANKVRNEEAENKNPSNSEAKDVLPHKHLSISYSLHWPRSGKSPAGPSLDLTTLDDAGAGAMGKLFQTCQTSDRP